MTKKLSFEEVLQMRRGTNAYDIFLFPFTKDDIPVAIRLLSQQEVKISNSDARRKADNELYKPGPNEYSDYLVREMLYKACYVVNDSGKDSDLSQKFFTSPEQVGELTMDEVNILLQHYNEVQEKFSPMVEVKDENDLLELIEEVKKKSHRGMSLSTHTLKLVLHYLISHSTKLPTTNESTSSPSKSIKKNSKKKLWVRMDEKETE